MRDMNFFYVWKPNGMLPTKASSETIYSTFYRIRFYIKNKQTQNAMLLLQLSSLCTLPLQIHHLMQFGYALERV